MIRPSLLIIALPLLVTACGKKTPKNAVDPFETSITERPTEGGLLQQDIDLDRDGQADIRNHFRERSDAPRLLLKKELDLNHDGKWDVVTIFNDEGVLERETMDSDYDGTFDWTDHYKEGVRVMSEYDTDNDGKPNVFRYFVKGADGVPFLDRKERDEDGDGRIDVWERFNREGQVIRTGRDTDGDGKVDVREE